MSYNNIAVRVQNLSKCYQIYDTPRDRLKQFIVPRMQRVIGQATNQYFREFWALKEISFEIKKGETVGIIGLNGSGKSTLLQIICGTLSPTSGTVETQGRITALLELGSGFNPEFTGRENVYMNAAVLGLSREAVNQRFDDIAAFADIGEFIEQPVKTYSSGMVVRLAFAVQTAVDPDVLIIDEALAVGDAPFQTKCFARMRELISKGTNVLFVSHDLSSVRAFCDKAIYLKNGILQSYSSAMDVCNLYTMACIEAIGVKTEMMQQVANPISHFLSKDVLASNKSKVHIFSPEFEKQAARNRSGSGLVRIINFYFESMEGQIVKDVAHNLIYNAVFILEAYADFYREIHLAVAIKDLKGTEFLEVRDSHYVEPLQLRAGQRAVAKMQITLPLHAGEYYATIGMLAFCVGDKFKDGTFNFPSAELCDLIEYGYFFSVAPFHKYYIRSPVHQESNLVITYLKKP